MTGVDPRFPSRFQAGYGGDAAPQAEQAAEMGGTPASPAPSLWPAPVPASTARPGAEAEAEAEAPSITAAEAADAPVPGRPWRVSRPVLLVGLLIVLSGLVLHAGAWYLLSRPGREVTLTDPETFTTYTTIGPLTNLAYGMMASAAVPTGIGCAAVVLSVLLPVMRTHEEAR